MTASPNAAQDLYTILMKSTRSIFGIDELYHDFPEARDVRFDSRTLFDLTRLVKKEDLDESQGFIYRTFLSKLLQKAIDNGETEFELTTSWPIGTTPYCLKAKDKRVKLAITGDLGDQAVKEARNLDVAVYGSAGEHFLIFSHGCRAYVSGRVGDFPMSQSRSCTLDAEMIGANPILVSTGQIIVRGITPRNLHDARSLVEYFKEASPLIGDQPSWLIRMRARKIVQDNVKETGLDLLCSGNGNKHFRHIDYEKPFWRPRQIYSQA